MLNDVMIEHTTICYYITEKYERDKAARGRKRNCSRCYINTFCSGHKLLCRLHTSIAHCRYISLASSVREEQCYHTGRYKAGTEYRHTVCFTAAVNDR